MLALLPAGGQQQRADCCTVPAIGVAISALAFAVVVPVMQWSPTSWDTAMAMPRLLVSEERGIPRRAVQSTASSATTASSRTGTAAPSVAAVALLMQG
ncbi:hypothetical protein [Stenotrophomonas sp. PS02297]|uniref:hypothetical protein n=1 Tax=Stenotrophomonas sp. PS02297 TaxID=2991423 RepID=UPI00249B879E|nr:hypothetical protein [Stenotrophomonas sp. PS02297]